MKLFTSTAIALAGVVLAGPAAAQSYGAPPQQSMQAPPAQQDNAQKPAEAQPKITPSKGALKAIVELQDAVNKNDYASVPAKVAAANAVAKTKEDHGEQLGLTRLNHIVDDDFDQPGRHQLEGSGQPGEHEGADHHRAVRTEILKDTQ